MGAQTSLRVEAIKDGKKERYRSAISILLMIWESVPPRPIQNAF